MFPRDLRFDPSRPFTRADAVREGLASRLRSSEYRRLSHGIYVSAATPITPLIRAQAALLPFGPRAWASHATAARLFDLPIPALPDEHVTVLDRNARRDRDGIVCHLAAGGEVRMAAGLRVPSPRQLFLEMASLLSLVDLVVLGDELVHRGVTDPVELSRFCAGATGPGASRAREGAAFVRAGVDSPMETRLRMLVVLGGLPEPEVNPLVGDGVELRKYDLCYRRSRTILEYDGRHHVERVEQWASDLSRREAIDDDAWRILVFIAKDIYATPGTTLDRVHRVLLRRREPGVPRVLSDEWRRHFPGRG